MCSFIDSFISLSSDSISYLFFSMLASISFANVFALSVRARFDSFFISLSWLAEDLFRVSICVVTPFSNSPTNSHRLLNFPRPFWANYKWIALRRASRSSARVLARSSHSLGPLWVRGMLSALPIDFWVFIISSAPMAAPEPQLMISSRGASGSPSDAFSLMSPGMARCE